MNRIDIVRITTISLMAIAAYAAAAPADPQVVALTSGITNNRNAANAEYQRLATDWKTKADAESAAFAAWQTGVRTATDTAAVAQAVQLKATYDAAKQAADLARIRLDNAQAAWARMPAAPANDAAVQDLLNQTSQSAEALLGVYRAGTSTAPLAGDDQQSTLLGSLAVSQAKGAVLATTNIFTGYARLFEFTEDAWYVPHRLIVRIDSSVPAQVTDNGDYLKAQLLRMDGGVVNLMTTLSSESDKKMGELSNAWGDRKLAIDRHYVSKGDVSNDEVECYYLANVGPRLINTQVSSDPDAAAMTLVGTACLGIGFDGALRTSPKTDTGGFSTEACITANVGNKKILNSVLGADDLPAYYYAFTCKVNLYVTGSISVKAGYSTALGQYHDTLGETYSLGLSLNR